MKRLALALLIVIMIALPVQGAGLNLRADEIMSDLMAEQVTASGDLELVIEDQVLTGALLQYDWGNQEGLITNFRTVADGLIITGSEAKVVDNVVYITGASITKCTLPQPELELYTKLLTFDLETRRVTTKGTWIKVFGRKIVPEPSLSFILDDSRFGRLSREGLPLPVVGADQTRGGYLGVTYQTLPGQDELFRGKLVHAAKTGWEGDIEYLRRLGQAGTFSASWQESPDYEYGLGGLRADYDHSAGRFALVAAQYQEENEKVLRYLPEFRFSGTTQTIGNLRYTPNFRWGYVESPENLSAASRILGGVTLDWRHDLVPGLYLEANAQTKAAWYQADKQESYAEGSHTVYLKKQVGDWTFGLGQQHSRVAGSPFFGEIDPLTPAKYALVSTGFARESNDGAFSGSTTIKYDLKTREYSSAMYTLGVSRETSALSLTTKAGLEHNLITNSISMFSVTGELALGGKWGAAADVEYDFEADKWEKGDLSLLRKLHCYDIKLEYNLVEKGFGTSIEFTW